MAAVSFTSFANSLLQSQLHLVVGSTPESIRDEIIKSGMAENPEQAKAFIMACLVASASVKKATEAFISDPKMNLARQAIQQVANLNGVTNMSVLVLAGHCFLTSDFLSDVEFVKGLRRRLGQDNLWAGDLTGGSTSDKRKAILKQHKEKAPAGSAKMFGSGFFKFVKLDAHAMTADEARFWKRATPRSGSPSNSSHTPVPETPQQPRAHASPGSSLVSTPSPLSQSAKPHMPESRPAAQPVPRATSPPKTAARSLSLTVGSSTPYKVPADIMDYLTTVLHWTDDKIKAQVDKDGIPAFEAKIRKIIEKDPNRLGIAGTSIGR